MLESIPDIPSLFDRKSGIELETILNAYMAGDEVSTDTTTGVEKYASKGDDVLDAMHKLPGT